MFKRPWPEQAAKYKVVGYEEKKKKAEVEEAKKRFVEQSTLLNVDTTSISSMIQTLIEKIDNFTVILLVL